MKDEQTKKVAFDEELERRFQEILARYPTKEAALLPTLWLAQERWGCLSEEVMEYVAERLGLSPVRVFAVVEFYTMFHREPTGRYHLQLCRNLSCTLAGAENLLALLREKVGIEPGGRTEDGLFSLELVECLGSCGTAPVMRINDTYYESLNRGRLEELLEMCRQGKLDPSGAVRGPSGGSGGGSGLPGKRRGDEGGGSKGENERGAGADPGPQAN